MVYLVLSLFYLIPVAAIVFFVISLVRFCSARKKNRLAPGSYSDSQMTSRKLMLIISSIIVGVLVAVVVGFMLLVFMAVAYM